MRGTRGSTVGALVSVAALAVAALSAGGSSATGSGGRAARPPDCHSKAPPILHDGFPEPSARHTKNGVPDPRLRAALGKVSIDGRRVTTLNYEGSFPGPTLVICAGDKLTVH